MERSRKSTEPVLTHDCILIALMSWSVERAIYRESRQWAG
jgi:hypothetical protein